MDISTVALIIIVCSMVYYYFQRKTQFFEDRGIPHLTGVPFFGIMGGLLLRRKHITDVIKEAYNINPEAKYVGVFDFTRPVLVLRDTELIKNVTIRNFENFSDHKQIVDPSSDPIFGNNLFNLQGAKWKEVRALLSPSFTSSKMKTMYKLVAACVDNFIQYISELPAEERSMLEVKDLFNKVTNDAIATCAFGLSINSLKNPGNEFYTKGKEATNFTGLTSLKLFTARASASLFKFLKFRIVSEPITEFFINIIKTTIETRDKEGIKRPDMLQLMMDARSKDSKYLKHDIIEMTAQAFIFFFAGFDTTSTQMSFMAYELAVNPDVQKRLQEEIDEVMKKSNGNPSYEDVHEMPYLDAIFNETLRKHTQLSFIDRMCTRAFELPAAVPEGKPFTIPAGMNVWIPSTAIHKNPEYYKNPEKFHPDRYLHEKKTSLNDVLNLGFGIGPRGCIGNRFAIMESKILFVHLLHKFNLKPNEKTTIPLKYNRRSFILRAEGDYWLAIESRKN